MAWHRMEMGRGCCCLKPPSYEFPLPMVEQKGWKSGQEVDGALSIPWGFLFHFCVPKGAPNRAQTREQLLRGLQGARRHGAGVPRVGYAPRR